MTVGAAVPGMVQGTAAGADGINVAIPDIEARLNALTAQLAALASMPPLPSFPDMLARAQSLVAAMQLALATPGLPPPPSIASSIAALMSLITSLQSAMATVNARLDIIVQLQTLQARAGVHVVAFESAAGSVGSELQSAINTPIPSGTARGVALITTSGTTWSVMQQVFKVAP